MHAAEIIIHHFPDIGNKNKISLVVNLTKCYNTNVLRKEADIK